MVLGSTNSVLREIEWSEKMTFEICQFYQDLGEVYMPWSFGIINAPTDDKIKTVPFLCLCLITANTCEHGNLLVVQSYHQSENDLPLQCSRKFATVSDVTEGYGVKHIE